MSRQIFSDSWHIVSTLKLSLINSVTIHKQYFRGTMWFVVQDTFNNKFFRIKPEAYEFIIRLNIDYSVEEIWEEYLIQNPETAPTQEELVTLLSQLHMHNLLYFKNRPKSDDMFQRYIEQKEQKIKGQLMSFLYMKVPIFDPEKFLKIIQPVTKMIFSIQGFLIWLIVLGYGIKSVIDNGTTALSQAQGILSPSNLIYLYISLFLLKILHEFGHAMMCKKFGGSVHTIGLMFLIFTPLPYMDASSSWKFKNKWHRVLVGSAGMLVELFFASIFAVIWANTGEGLLHNLSFNIMVVGSISSLVFNANPLLKFDAYYMLSDALEIPNLFGRSKEQVYHLFQKYIFGVEQLEAPHHSTKEAFWLFSYSITSTFYRFLVSLTIALFVADQMFILGIVVAILSIFVWILKPTYTFLKYLLSSQKLNKNRYRAVSISILVFMLLSSIIIFIPIQYSINAKGVLYPKDFTTIYATDNGYLSKIYLKSGEFVKKGELIASLDSYELDLDILMTEAKIKETKALQLKAHKNIADLSPLTKRLKTLENKLLWQKKRRDNLIIYAPISGIWIEKSLSKLKNSIIKKRETMGYIIPNNGFEFKAVVPQEMAFDLFKMNKLNGDIKLNGIPSKTIKADSIYVIPYEQHKLPSSALGWFGGGDIKVSQADSTGRTSIEAFFEIRADIIKDVNNPMLLHNRVGILKIVLPKKPLGEQIYKSIQQIMRKRYTL